MFFIYLFIIQFEEVYKMDSEFEKRKNLSYMANLLVNEKYVKNNLKDVVDWIFVWYKIRT